MDRSTRDFYAHLSDGYDTTIRQLVPRYDDMLERLVDIVVPSHPTEILDIGAGTGGLAERLAHRSAGTRVTALEPSSEMALGAERRLAPLADRVVVLQGDVRHHAPDRRIGAVVTNLVLHNLPSNDKHDVLSRILGWLTPNGLFAWGDLVRQPDPDMERRAVETRVAFARETGCAPETIRENFSKEATLDHPWTVDQSLHALTDAGFFDATCVWRHDTFAIVSARAPA